eukprot:scaffold69486_cov57-Attheya_sp.AAC.7
MTTENDQSAVSPHSRETQQGHVEQCKQCNPQIHRIQYARDEAMLLSALLHRAVGYDVRSGEVTVACTNDSHEL